MGLQGESLPEAEISTRGVTGDHLYVVRDSLTGRILDPKSHPYSWGETSALTSLIELKSELLGWVGTEDLVRLTLPGGEAHEGRPDDLGKILGKALSREVDVVKYPRIVESRVLSGRTLHLLTTASLASMKKYNPMGDFDLRRFRPNIFVQSTLAEGFVEETWVGRKISLGGSVNLKVEKPNIRCVVPTLRQGQLSEDRGILESVERSNGKKLGVMCSVLGEGKLRAGDQIYFD